MQQGKDSKGQFIRKGEVERKVRSIRLTDNAWHLLGEKASSYNMNRADFLEALLAKQIEW